MKKLYILLAAGVVVLAFSCNKKNLGYITRNGAPTTLNITVKDSSNKAAPGLTVSIYHPDPNASDSLKKTGVTGSSGVAFFDFSTLFDRGQTGVATLFVAVIATNGDTLPPKNANDKRFDLEPETANEHEIILK